MAKPIQSREQADRLARAICADIALYNRAALISDPTGEDVKDALREGLLLYRARVLSMEEVFLAAADGILFAPLAAQHRDTLRGVLSGAARETPSAPATSREASPARRGDSGDGVSVALIGLVLLAVAIAVVLLMR